MSLTRPETGVEDPPLEIQWCYRTDPTHRETNLRSDILSDFCTKYYPRNPVWFSRGWRSPWPLIHNRVWRSFPTFGFQSVHSSYTISIFLFTCGHRTHPQGFPSTSLLHWRVSRYRSYWPSGRRISYVGRIWRDKSEQKSTKIKHSKKTLFGLTRI